MQEYLRAEAYKAVAESLAREAVALFESVLAIKRVINATPNDMPNREHRIAILSISVQLQQQAGDAKMEEVIQYWNSYKTMKAKE